MTKLLTMKPLIYLLLSLFSIDSIFADKPITEADCKDDEKFVDCGRCEITCENFDESLCASECRPMCKCETGKIRNSDGKCVFTSQCDDPTYNPCGTNETLVNTPQSWCFASCRDPNPPCLQHNNIFGTEVCGCAKGFIRNNSRKCVLPSDCPKDVNECDENESLRSSQCEPTCENPNVICHPGIISPSGPICQCSQGFVRNYAGKCVIKTEC